MLYSETELKKRLKSGCPVFYFYASDEALVRSAAAKAEKFLSEEAPDTTTLDGPTPSVEDIVLAAGTISFFGGRRLVMLPLIRPSAYSDKDLQELCDTLSDTENAVFVLTSLLEEKYGKIKPGKREQKLIAACEKLGYCVQIAKPGRAALQEMARTWAGEYQTPFAPGAEAALLDRCGDDQFLLQNEIAKLAALSGYTTITTQMIQQLGTVTLDADTFDMVKLVAAGNTRQALAKLQTLLELQNKPILLTGWPRSSGREKAGREKRAAARLRTWPRILSIPANGTTALATRIRLPLAFSAARSKKACASCKSWTWI